jgi:hypothetical protein
MCLLQLWKQQRKASETCSQNQALLKEGLGNLEVDANHQKREAESERKITSIGVIGEQPPPPSSPQLVGFIFFLAS